MTMRRIRWRVRREKLRVSTNLPLTATANFHAVVSPVPTLSLCFAVFGYRRVCLFFTVVL